MKVRGKKPVDEGKPERKERRPSGITTTKELRGKPRKPVVLGGGWRGLAQRRGARAVP